MRYSPEKHSSVKIVRLWYQFTSPPELLAEASLDEREAFRRGRTGSRTGFFLFLLLVTSLPAAFAGSNSLLIVILVISLGTLIVALLLNRLMIVNLAGVLVVLSVIAGPTANILTTPGGVNTSALPIFGFLVLPLMCAVSFLSPRWVFVVAAFNSLFVFCVLKFFPSAGELHGLLQVAFPGIVTPIILSQWIVAIVAFLWVHEAKKAIARADRDEEIIKLQQEINRHSEERAIYREKLEESIHMIEVTHAQVANGALAARVPLNQNNILWGISGQLNNLISRIQSLHKEALQLPKMQFGLQKAREENERLTVENRQLKEENAYLKEKQGRQSY